MAIRWPGPRSWLVLLGTAVVIAGALGGAVVFGVHLGRHIVTNELCCEVFDKRNLRLSLNEMLGRTRFSSQIGQDKWVLEGIYPGVRHGYFLDVGSGDGTVNSNSKALEEAGWNGICVDPFPKNMQGRRCQMFKEVVASEAGKVVSFKDAGDIGGITDTLGVWKENAKNAKTVEFKTVTLGDILDRAKAPKFIEYMSLDIEGAEVDALRGFPFDRYQVGAIDVEHNFEEPKRWQLLDLLTSHGYRLVNTWQQDDFYVRSDVKARCGLVIGCVDRSRVTVPSDSQTKK